MAFYIECNTCAGPGASAQVDDGFDAREWAGSHRCDERATVAFYASVGLAVHR